MSRKRKKPLQSPKQRAAKVVVSPPATRAASLKGGRWLAAGLIALAAIATYWNIRGHEFLRFDDRKYIYDNELVTGDGGAWAIWADIGNPEPRLHYQPATYTTFWLEHALVGLEPSEIDADQVVGQAAHPLYHWTQILLHALNGILIMLTLCALGVSMPVATLTALFFVVHPVNVESVAWTAERKNLLSGAFFWLSLLTYITHRHRGTAASYVGALWAFALALLSKSASMVLAPVLILTDRVIDRRWTWASIMRSLPFFVMGIVMGAVALSREESLGTRQLGELLPLQFKPLVAASVVTHYVGRILFPIRQLLIDRRWELSLAEPRYWTSLAALASALLLMIHYRSRLGLRWFWSLGLFLLAIVPVLGFQRFAWMQWSFVSDHYMYYGSVGVILMVLLGAERVWRAGGLKTGALALACVAALFACGWRTAQWNETWRNDVTLWTHTLALNPDAFQGHVTLGDYYQKRGNLDAAYHHRKEFARIMNFARTWRACAQLARKLERHEEARRHYERAIEVASSRNDREHVIHTEYARYLASLGNLDEALAEYEAVLVKHPPTAATLQAEMETLRRRLSQTPVPLPP